jgi:hypothetical protein
MRNPFEEISGLEQILIEEDEEERRKRHQKPLVIEYSLDDSMMTN